VRCLRDSLLGYLQQVDTVCDVQVASTLCNQGSVLDASTYLPDNLTISTSTSKTFSIQKDYYCVNEEDYKRIKRQVPSKSISAANSFPEEPFGTQNVNLCPDVSSIALSGSGVCENVVVNVTYEVMWESDQIVGITASIYLTNFTLNEDDDEVMTQYFQVRYKHNNQTSSSERSGNPGYNKGLPIITSTNQSLAGRSNNLYTWKPGPTGSCEDVGLSEVSFGLDHSSGCIIRLNLANFSDCSLLRNQVERFQQNLFQNVNFVSRFGNPADFSTDFLDLIDETDAFNATTELDSVGQCADIPSDLIIEVIVSQSGKIRGFPVNEILYIRVRYQRHLWKMSCKEASTCDLISDVSEPFSISSIVSFVDLNSNSDQQDNFNERRSCVKDATCWKELFHPLTYSGYQFQPDDYSFDQIQYNLACTLLIIFSIFGKFRLHQCFIV